MAESVAQQALGQTNSKATFADLFSGLPHDLGCYLIGYAASRSLSTYAALLQTSISFNQITTDHSDLSGLPIVLGGEYTINLFYECLQRQPRLGLQVTHLWAWCGSPYHKNHQGHAKLVASMIHLCPNIQSLAIDGPALGFCEPTVDLLKIQSLTMTANMDFCKQFQPFYCVLRRVTYLRFLSEMSSSNLRSLARDNNLPRVRWLIIPILCTQWGDRLERVGTEIRNTFPCAQQIGLMPIGADINGQDKLIALKNRFKTLGLERRAKFIMPHSSRRLFPESVQNQNYAWEIAEDLESSLPAAQL
jgi:hypothetical protein